MPLQWFQLLCATVKYVSFLSECTIWTANIDCLKWGVKGSVMFGLCMFYSTMPSVTKSVPWQMVTWLMNGELEGMCKGNGCSFFNYSDCPCIFLEGPRNKNDKNFFRTISVSAGIQNCHVPYRAYIRSGPAGQLPGALSRHWNNRKYGASKLRFPHVNFSENCRHFGHAPAKVSPALP
jgi:hypothetical protein